MEGKNEENPRQPQNEESSLISGEKKKKTGSLSKRRKKLTRDLCWKREEMKIS
jgi:hypothetical protein